MSDPNPLPNFPSYTPPLQGGIPYADPSQSRFLFKAIRSLGRTMQKPAKLNRGKNKVESNQSVRIKRRKQKFW